jgi:hypothetical protein
MSPTLLAVSTAVLLGLLVFAQRKSKSQRANAADQAAALREGVLSRRMLQGLPPSAPDAIRGVVMDWNVSGAIATLVAIDDGSVSLYLNPGGGIIGAGTHAPVASAAVTFRNEGTRQRASFRSTSAYPPPVPDAVTFYLLTDSATLTSQSFSTDALQQPEHPFAMLGATAQALIAEVRQVGSAS